MSREIKFRAFDGRLKKMICTGYHVIGEVTMFSLIDQYCDENPVEGMGSLVRYQDIIESQYTGKKDCEGKEIYEGDIIEFDRREWGGDDNIHVVSWDDQDARWSWGGGNSGDMDWRKVIGNIYENPELLTP